MRRRHQVYGLVFNHLRWHAMCFAILLNCVDVGALSLIMRLFCTSERRSLAFFTSSGWAAHLYESENTLQPIAHAHRKTVMMSFDRFWAISLFCCLLHWRHTHFFVHRCHRNHSYSICTHLCTIWWPSEKPQNMYNFLSLIHEPLSFSNGLLFIHFNVVGFKLRNFMRDSTNCTQNNMAKIGSFLSHCPHNFH